jgi:hypothetical protein
LVPAGVIIAIVRSSATNHTGNVIGIPSRRNVVRIPVCADAISSHASSGVSRIIGSLQMLFAARSVPNLEAGLPQTLQ